MKLILRFKFFVELIFMLFGLAVVQEISRSKGQEISRHLAKRTPTTHLTPIQT